MNALQIQTTCKGLLALDSYPPAARSTAIAWFQRADSWAVSYCPGCLELIGKAREHLERICPETGQSDRATG